jgi:hypothetical protein
MDHEKETQDNNRCINKLQLVSKRENHEYQWRAAKKVILSRLVNWPKAQPLAAQICDFYGDCLRYYEDSALDASYYQIELQHDPVALQYARIELQLGTSRTAEALCHELLHLNTRVLGYPIGEKFLIPYELTQYAHAITGIYPKIGNLLEHELILGKFMDLGFDKCNFLGCISPPPDYKKLATLALNSVFYQKEVGFPWWCLEYFRHWISTRHWVGDEPAMYADYALFWGSKVHPALGAAAQNIRELIESEALLDKHRHHHYFNKLMELMRIPKFTEWAFIQKDGNGEPLVFRLTQNEKIKPHSVSTQHVAKAMGTSY